ncbi:MAG: hypothetical protein KatS3mg002_0777 [Candidatus Woesearchaeota archaeon]|nr:MAG: hypothetical protein KatS3mg002_0777 [Candidatus Woesearchaeota archaeon]
MIKWKIKIIDTSNMTDEEIMELQKKNCIFCNIAKKEHTGKDNS